MRGPHGLARAGAALALALGVASPAQAGDGRVEINQVKALAGRVTPSDTPGFPVTIDTPGSYVLTGSLTVSDPNSDGIEVVADSVSLDLNGFAIIGTVDCTGLGSARTCPRSAGSGRGIDAAGRTRVAVRDGRVLGFDRGVEVGFFAQLRNVTVESNRNEGLKVGWSIVRECTAYQNGDGIAAPESVVARSSASSNQLTGIKGSVLLGNTAYDNGEDGLAVTEISSGNQVIQNERIGISVNNGVVVGNTVNDNGHGVTAAAGIYGNSNVVLGNSVNGNALPGLAGPSGLPADASAYADNQLWQNNGGTPNPQVTQAAEIGVNFCHSVPICP